MNKIAFWKSWHNEWHQSSTQMFDTVDALLLRWEPTKTTNGAA